MRSSMQFKTLFSVTFTVLLIFGSQSTCMAQLWGDVDCDADVDYDDFTILSSNYGQSVTPFEDGDINGDGVVDFADFLILSDTYGMYRVYFGDTDCDGDVDFADFLTLSSNMGNHVTPFEDGDLDGNGFVNDCDYQILLATFGQTRSFCGDANGDGFVDFSDFLILSDNWEKMVVPFTNGDFDGNGYVNMCDYNILVQTFGQAC